MKLFFTPGACSLSPHIVARELGLDFTPVKVDLATKTTSEGADFKAINPRGYVPAIQLDDGRVLTEGPAIIQFLADQKPDAGLAPKQGTWERYELQETLNFISTEIHKQFSPLFNAANPDSVKDAQKEKLASRFDLLDAKLAQQPYLTGDSFSVADAYLFTVLGWSRYFNIDLGRWPAISAFVERTAARPAVMQAMAFEAQAKKG